MVAQLSFNFEELLRAMEEIEKPRKKRIRYLVPTYVKFYPLYRYNRAKFTELMKEWLNTAEGKNRTYQDLLKKQNEILEQCYVRDENGNKLKDCDEQHIFRIRVLHRIYEEIYLYVGAFRSKTKEIRFDDEEKEAWLNINDLELSIKQRVIIHLRLLRGLRKGLSIKEAICQLNGK